MRIEKGYITVERLAGENSWPVKLEDGRLVVRNNGKYGTGLTFIGIEGKKYPKNEIKYDGGEFLNVELDSFHPDVIYGRFFKNKRGTKIFELGEEEDSPHMLISIYTGRDFSVYHEGPQREAFEGAELYWSTARSNGGGRGNIYIILPKGWKKKLTLDQI